MDNRSSTVMGDIVGIGTSSVLILLVCNYWPKFDLDLYWQGCLVVTVPLLLVGVWRSSKQTSISRRTLVLRAIQLATMTGIFVLIDVAAGSSSGKNFSFSESFLNSHGPFGWLLTSALALLVIFVGIPTFFRNLYLSYRNQTTEKL